MGGMGVGGLTTIEALDKGDSSISGRVALKADSAAGDMALVRPSCERIDGLTKTYVMSTSLPVCFLASSTMALTVVKQPAAAL